MLTPGYTAAPVLLLLSLTIGFCFEETPMIEKPTAHPAYKSVAAAALCCALAACGGGSDAPSVISTPGATPSGAPPANAADVAPLPNPVAAAQPAAPAPAASASAPPPAPAAIGSSCGLNGAAGIQAEVLQRLNALRAAGAVCGTNAFAATGALAWNNQLLQAAVGHSADMAQKNYFAHTSQDGRSASQRVTDAGYNWSTVGENIAAGQRSVEEVMTGWAKSPGHCQNLMNPNFRDVAVACVRNDASTYGLYWSMELGRSR